MPHTRLSSGIKSKSVPMVTTEVGNVNIVAMATNSNIKNSRVNNCITATTQNYLKVSKAAQMYL